MNSIQLYKNTLLLFFIAFYNLISYAQIQSDKSNDAIMPLYGLHVNDLDNITPTTLNKFSAMGLNTFIMGGTKTELESIVNKFNTYSKLSKFKVILSVSSPSYDAYIASDYSNDLTSTNLNNFKTFLNNVVQLAITNSNVVSGYYTFDEPAINPFDVNKDNIVERRGISKEFQIAVYNYIRALDPDGVKRPICLANTLYWDSSWGPSDHVVNYSLSNLAQDIIFIDQYSADKQQQIGWFTKWRDKGITDPFVYILKGYSNSCISEKLAENNADSVAHALNHVYGSNLPTCKGIGVFAYWPIGKPDFSYSMDNCSTIFNETQAYFHLKSYGYLNWGINSSFCDDGSIKLTSNGTGNSFGIRIVQTDANGLETGTPYHNVISNTPMDGFSITNWCKSRGIVLKPKNYYRISIGAGYGGIYGESSKVIYYNACTWNLISEVSGTFGGWSPAANDKRIVGDFDGDGTDELFIIQNSGPLASLLKYNTTTNTWYSLASSSTGTIANSWGISSTDNYVAGDFDGDGRDELLFSNPNGWAQMVEYVPSSHTWAVQWHNGGNGWIGSWNILNNVQMLSGDFDSNTANKELLFIQNKDAQSWAMVQGFQNGMWTNPYWSNSGNGFISGWGIHLGDRFLVGDLDGNGLKNDLFCANNGAWTGVERFNSSTNSFTWSWNNGGSGWTQDWNMITSSDIVLAGNLDADANEELLFLNTGTTASYAMSQSFNSTFNITKNWWNNGDPAQINNWPLYSTSGCYQNYQLFRIAANQSKKLLAYRSCTNGNWQNIYGVMGSHNMKSTSIEKGLIATSKDVNEYMHIYPNPSPDGIFYVNVSENATSNYTLEVFDVLGNCIHKQLAHGGINELKLEEKFKGMYIIKLLENTVIKTTTKLITK